MTTPSAEQAKAGDAIEKSFVDLWRRMATLWGISPAMAEVHGLLYITGAALSMDDIMARLGMSRGNTSMNLAKLVEWGLVRRVHQRGDRRSYFESLTDVWEIFTVIASQRKRREIDPILNTLRECREELGASQPETEARRRRIDDLYSLLASVDSLAQRFFASQRSLRSAFEILAQKDD